MAFLELVNSLRVLLRENQVDSVGGSSPDLVVQMDLVNRAIRRVMARRSWSFLQRHDGYLYFPASVDGTNGTFTQGNTTATLGLTTGSSGQAAGFSEGHLVAKVTRPDDSRFPNTSYRLTDLETTGSTQATFVDTWRGDTDSATTFTIYANEARFPTNVANVIGVRNEENVPIRFESMDTFDEFDRLFPHESQTFTSFPWFVAIGGHVVPTSQDGGSVTEGIGLRFYPPNSSDLLLRYSYIRRVSELTSDTDDLTDVPAEVQDLIVDFAFEEALNGNIEDDPVRARQWQVRNENNLRELMKADTRDVGRRYVPRPFNQNAGSLDPYSWIRSFPEPS